MQIGLSSKNFYETGFSWLRQEERHHLPMVVVVEE